MDARRAFSPVSRLVDGAAAASMTFTDGTVVGRRVTRCSSSSTPRRSARSRHLSRTAFDIGADPKMSDVIGASRAVIRLSLPVTVLISPLCAIAGMDAPDRTGKCSWRTAECLPSAGQSLVLQSGRKALSCGVVSMPMN